MAYKLLLPKFGMAMEFAKVIEWLKNEGDYVEKEEAVLIVENEKLSNEIVSMEAGVLLRKVAQEGEKYLVGDLLAYLGAAGETIEDAESVEPAKAGKNSAVQEGGATESGGRVVASPLAKKVAAQLGVDIGKVPGSGPRGRVERADVEKYAEAAKAAPVPASGSVPASAPEAPPREAAAPVARTADQPDFSEIPYTGIRQTIGVNMLQAWTSVPMVTHHVKADAASILEIRERLNQDSESKEERVSVNDILLKLTASALKKMPAVNASLTGEVIRVYHSVHLGIATALDNGLIVPVVRDADKKSLLQISREAKDLIAKARSGKLSADEVTGGTFTVTNLGGYASVDEFTPIINPPQAAILGIGRTV
ncbi:MAG: 2-oxo acid dehydrogenase subunit E2, partial [Clostridiales bacterium]|nr:2-oxo acid dehydrogenase subunit E2 [Clostridiales bacterium]